MAPKQMPNAQDIVFKDKFVERYSQLTDFDSFKLYSTSFLRRAIRVNTLKISVEDLKKRLSSDWELTPVPWCKEGFWIEHKGEEKRRDIGNLREHALGYFYVQEPASMIPPLVLDPQPGEFVLDMCCAPGSKGSQIAQYMKNTGVLIANDYKGMRLAPLGINLQRVGVTNSIITLMHGERFKGLQFDRILVDAPCSGTGTVRKSLKTLLIWNPGMIQRLGRTQKQLIVNAFSNLKKGGTMVYSTCSCEPEENEEVVSHLLDTCPDAHVEAVKLPGLKTSPCITSFNEKEYRPEVKDCIRIWPQDNDTEGFFVAKISKQ